jgi:acetaldehyde dehydrogenase (acetylating)
MTHRSTRSSDLVSRTGIPSVSVFLNLFTIDGNFELLGLLSSNIDKSEGLKLYEIAGICNMTRNKCLKRLTELQDIGLVFKAESTYYSSKLGAQIFDQIIALRDAIYIHSKLKAVDAIQSSNSLNNDEVSDLVQALITNNRIKSDVTNIIQSPVLSKTRKAHFSKLK